MHHQTDQDMVLLPRHDPRRPRRVIGAHEAVMRFLAWMREHDLVGWIPGDEIPDYYAWHCAEEGLEEVHRDVLRARLDGAPGVIAERRRINGAAFASLKAYLQRLGRPAERVELYRIASLEEMAEAAPAPKRKKPAAGSRPANAEARMPNADARMAA